MSAATVEPHKSSIGGMDANVMALIVYIGAAVIGWIPVLKYFAWLFPVVIFFLEKNSSFVKFHAVQAFALNVAGALLGIIVSVIIGGIVSASMITANPLAVAGAVAVVGFFALAVSIVITVFAIIAIYNAYMYRQYYIPVIGKFAEKIAMKMGAK